MPKLAMAFAISLIALEVAQAAPKPRLHAGDVVRFRTGTLLCKTKHAALTEESFGREGLPSCIAVPPTEDIEVLAVSYDKNDAATAQVRALATHGAKAWLYCLDDAYWDRTSKHSIYDR